MVRNNSSAEAKNSLLQLSNWGQVSNNDRDGIDAGADSAGSEESSHAAAQSIITQVSDPTRYEDRMHNPIYSVLSTLEEVPLFASSGHCPSSKVNDMVVS